MIAGIGTEGRTLPDLIDVLTKHKIDLVVDIRSATSANTTLGLFPLALSMGLAAYAIDYVRMKALSGARARWWAEQRQQTAAHRDGSHGAVHVPLYAQWLEAVERADPDLAEATAEFIRLTSFAANGRIAVLCTERDQNHCVRDLLIRAVATRTARPAQE